MSKPASTVFKLNRPPRAQFPGPAPKVAPSEYTATHRELDQSRKGALDAANEPNVSET